MTDFAKSRCVIVGYGSIGARHTRILQELGCSVVVVSRRVLETVVAYPSIVEAVQQQKPNYVVIANETALHHDALVQLAAAGYQGMVLMEKPLFETVRAVPIHQFRDLRVAYNLRFHPVIVRLKALLAHQEILSVQAYVGQYLPNWRPGADYRESYSARSEMGGGALLDLSHDLDYLAWMIGPWRRVAAIGGRMSALEITSDDVFSLLYESDRCPAVGVQLNYLDRLGRRRVIANTADHTYEADLVCSSLRVDGEELHFPVERDTSYRAMHAAILSGNPAQACPTQEALDTLALCAAARDAAAGGHWRQR